MSQYKVISPTEIDTKTFQIANLSELFDEKIRYPHYACKELFFDFIQNKNSDEITIEFSGSGDSGSIEAVSGIDEMIIKADFYGKWLFDYVDNLADEILDISGHDWYNNEGGHGTIEIDVPNRKIKLEMSIAYTHYEEFEEEY